MCALFGWLDYKGIVSDRLLKKLTQALANAAEERGTDASGIAYVKSDKVTIYKRPKPAHKLRFNAPNGTRAVMGHTRMTTQGNEKFNYNNHPFYGHADVDFAFAHNGVLYNDKELRVEKHLPQTQIETDSYVAVQLLEQQDKLDFDSLKSMAESVQGSFCFTALDENNTLYIIKGSNPMCLLHFAELGLYIYASTESILKKALQKAGFHKYPFEVLNVDEGTILKIDRYGFLSGSTFEVQESFRFGKWADWYDELEEEYYSQQEELLLEMCSCYGVTEEDVLLLLDYGYSADEIEEMLCDSNLLLETRGQRLGRDRPLQNCQEYALCQSAGIHLCTDTASAPSVGNRSYCSVHTKHHPKAVQEIAGGTRSGRDPFSRPAAYLRQRHGNAEHSREICHGNGRLEYTGCV